jgi:hypothetical protein
MSTCIPATEVMNRKGMIRTTGGYFCLYHWDRAARKKVYVNGAHRIAYEECFGPIPDGLQVMHSCDNPACVNPEHLSVGTTQDNTADRTAKGRTPYGERHAGARMTEQDVRSLRACKGVRGAKKKLIEQLGISKGAADNAIYGRTWKHVQT